MRSRAHIKTHPIHPILVSFPIAFFTGALVFDAIGFFGHRHMLHALAYYLCIAGIAGALLAAVPGLIDLLHTVPPRSSAKKRGTTHGLINSVVLLLFVAIVFIRRESFTVLVLMLETLAVSAMFVAGWMGGTLVHRNQIGIDHRYAAAGKWKEQWFTNPQFPLEVAGVNELSINQMKLLHVDGKRIVLAKNEHDYVAFDDRCPHRGGSLAGGVMMCGTVHCPWHGSQFETYSGKCLEGPATVGLQVYGVKQENGKVFLLDIG